MHIQYTFKTRENFIALIDEFSTEELNKIPEGYNNNIIWNFAHIIVTHQLLCYKLSTLEISLENTMIEAFRKGTKPERFYEEAEVKEFKNLAISTLENFKKILKREFLKNLQNIPQVTE